MRAFLPVSLTVLLTGAISLGQDNVTKVPVTIDSTRRALVAPQDRTETKERSQETLIINGVRFGTGIENREPRGSAEEFPSNVGRIYFWNEIVNSGDSTSIDHVWLYRGEEVARVDLPIKPLRNRTWSYKTVPSDWSGVLAVEVVLADSQVVARDSCVLK